MSLSSSNPQEDSSLSRLKDLKGFIASSRATEKNRALRQITFKATRKFCTYENYVLLRYYNLSRDSREKSMCV